MRNHPALVAMFTLAIGLSACGKYGPPVRSIPQESSPPAPMPRVEQEMMVTVLPTATPWIADSVPMTIKGSSCSASFCNLRVITFPRQGPSHLP